jgi:hypothetical protein
MGSSMNIEEFLKDLKIRLESGMPKVHAEVKLYEERLRTRHIDPKSSSITSVF